MVLNPSAELKGITVKNVLAVEIQVESAWALTDITPGTTCHASDTSSSEEEEFNIFLCVSIFEPRKPWRWTPFCPGATI